MIPASTLMHTSCVLRTHAIDAHLVGAADASGVEGTGSARAAAGVGELAAIYARLYTKPPWFTNAAACGWVKDIRDRAVRGARGGEVTDALTGGRTDDLIGTTGDGLTAGARRRVKRLARSTGDGRVTDASAGLGVNDFISIAGNGRGAAPSRDTGTVDACRPARAAGIGPGCGAAQLRNAGAAGGKTPALGTAAPALATLTPRWNVIADATPIPLGCSLTGRPNQRGTHDCCEAFEQPSPGRASASRCSWLTEKPTRRSLSSTSSPST